MNKNILNYLNHINNTKIVNKLIVTAFLKYKNIKNIKNIKMKNFIYKQDEDDYAVYEIFETILKEENQKLCFEELLELFEFVISPSEKLINGAIYTPKNIRQYITKQSFNTLQNKSFNNLKIADISCGCGGFLMDATIELKQRTKKSYTHIFKDNIFGVDIQKYSIERTEILLSLFAISEGEDEEIFEFNLYVADSLQFNWRKENLQIQQNGGFDLILGNPPYVCSRNMDEQTKKLMKRWSVSRTGHPDLYIPFFQIAYSLLTPKGILGFITVNTFMSSINGRGIREYFNKEKVLLKIIDFKDEQIFKDRMTYTCLCFIEKINSEYIYYTSQRESELIDLKKTTFNVDSYAKLDSHKGWSLKNSKLIEYLESIGSPFEKIYDTKSGIATLKNHVYIFKPIKTDRKYHYMEDGTPIEKNICKDIINTNQLKKYDNLNAIKEKIIFPYVHDKNNLAVLINERTLQNKFPKTYSYLSTQKSLLATRDKGKGKDRYPKWYAFGRTQSLEKRKEKLFFPQLVKEGFQTVYSDDENLYFYNGMAAYASKEELHILEKLLPSSIFWKYIENSAKHYISGYFGLGKNYLKNFGIYEFTSEEKEILLNLRNKSEINTFLNQRYHI